MSTVPVRYTDFSLILRQGFRLFEEWAHQNNVEVRTWPQDLEDIPEVRSVNRLKATTVRKRDVLYAVVMNVPDTPEMRERLLTFGKVCKGYPWPQ